MPLQTGSRLGPYEILSALGAGGMGEVYKAQDTRLGRTVALKVLPAHLSGDPERRQRFEREARTVSSLNHPHICILYDIGEQDGVDYLVMEYLEGETLAQRLAKGALPVEEALRYAVQIADALDKAHRQGVVHRDLKPGNVMLTKAGAKLLDFGLAKLRPPDAAAAGISMLPTQEAGLTAEGTILGTLQYMAPEQLEGKEADARTDIFAFGALLYEMTTGRKAFQGKSQASLIGAILKDQPPPVSQLQPMAAPALDHVVKICLRKDSDERWQSAHDLRNELTWIAEAGSQAGVPVPVVARRKSRERLGWMVSAFLTVPLVLALAMAIIHLREESQARHPMRFFISPPENLSLPIFGGLPAISPDGRHIVFAASGLAAASSPEQPFQIWVRSLDSLESRLLPGTEGGNFPFWSPDSRHIGFFGNGKLKKVAIAGGPTQALCDAPGGRGGTWNQGTIVFSPHWAAPLQQVSATGGEPKAVTALEESARELGHRWPCFLPDGRHFLYLAQGGESEKRGLYVGSLDSKERKFLVKTTANGAFVPPGYILFMRDSTLLAQSFDPQKLELRGDVFPIAENVDRNEHGYFNFASFSASPNGALVYKSGSQSARHRLVWFDRNGKEIGSIDREGEYTNPALSPDERRLAVGLKDPQTATRDIWAFDLVRNTSTRLTFDPGDDFNPVWSPDGSRVAFSSDRRGIRDLYQKMASGTGEEEILFESAEDKNLEDWSSDGRFLVFNSVNPASGGDLWILPLSEERKPSPYQKQKFVEHMAQFSPDGRWVTYVSNESGRSEVYVQPFPAAGGKWQVSTGGGIEPRWRADGKELFYREPNRLMALDLRAHGSSFEVGIPRPLFEAPWSGMGRNAYVAAANGQRFLAITAVAEAAPSPLTVVLNWDHDHF